MKGYHDIAGDGGSDVLGQVAARRSRIDRSLAGIRHRLAIGSGKGGVGKSTLTLRLAVALNARGLKVAVLDADLNGPTQARLAGLRHAGLVPGDRGLLVPRTPSGIGVVSLGSAVPESEAVDFDTVAEGASHVWRATKEFTVLGDLLERVVWGDLDFLLVDLPPGAERTQQYADFLGETTAFVLVTIPTDLARGVVARSLAALRKTPNRVLGYIENMDGYYCAGCEDVRPLWEGAGEIELGVPRLGGVPFDPALARASDLGNTDVCAGDGASLRAIDEIAARLTREMDQS